MGSLRLNGAALACFVQSGLKAICDTLRVVVHLEAISSAPFGAPLSRRSQIRWWLLEVEAAGERDLRSRAAT